MNIKLIIDKFVWIAIAAIVFSVFCLAVSGSGDDAESFCMYILSASIVLGSSFISLALLDNKKNE